MQKYFSQETFGTHYIDRYVFALWNLRFSIMLHDKPCKKKLESYVTKREVIILEILRVKLLLSH